MNGLKETLKRRAARSVAGGSDRLRERVLLTLARRDSGGLASVTRRKFSGPLVGLATAVAVAVIVGGVGLFLRGDPSVGGSTPTTLAPPPTETPSTVPSTETGPPTTSTSTTVSQVVVADAEPACNGEDSVETAGGQDEEGEDAPPGPPLPIPAGPCVGMWTTYTQAHGLPDCVCGLGVSPDGTTWVLSEFGDIVMFDGTGWTMLDTGILDVEALDFSRDGTLWVAGPTGIWAREAGEWMQKGDAPGEDIAASPDGSIWIYSKGRILRFDGWSWIEHALREPLQDPAEGTGADVSIDIASDGTLWLAAPGTLDSYDGTTWTAHSPAPGFTPQAVTIGPGGTVWMASASNPAFGGPPGRLGVGGLEEEGYGLTRYNGETWDAYPIPSYVDMAFAADGIIWVADAFIGAFRFDGQTWMHYTEAHGLAANSLELVAAAPDGTVWFKTLFGDVVRYQPTS